MKKQFEEEEELEQLLDEAFIREMKKQEQALFEQEASEPEEITDQGIEEAYKDLMTRLEKENNGEEKKEIRFLKRKKFGGRKIWGRYHVAKAAGFVLVATLCVFGATMTSEATRSYFVDNIRYLAGDDTKILVDNDENNEKANMNENEAISEIEKTLKVEVPEFLYRPKHFEFLQYSLNEIADAVKMEYLYNDHVIMFYIDKGNETNVSITDSLHGETLETLYMEEEDINIQIKKLEEQGDDISSHSAQWEKEGTIYVLSGKIDLEEMKKILEKMRY